MLVSLSVRDVVIIKNVELNFKNGFSTLTGETGAGKSILMDDLGLVLGAFWDPVWLQTRSEMPSKSNPKIYAAKSIEI